MSVRIALGALIIKEKLGTPDEETVEQIRENPYLQYFLGFTDYCDEEPFHPTMFVHFRKRFGKKAICQIIETVNQKAISTSKRSKDDHNDDSGGSATGQDCNKGKLLIDATCTPADITFPTDLKILNEAREKSERIIDILHRESLKSPGLTAKELENNFFPLQKARRYRKVKCAKPSANSWGIWGGI